MDNQELPNSSDWLVAGLTISLLPAPGTWEVATGNKPFQHPHLSQGEMTLLYSQPGICVMSRHSYKDFPGLVRFE